MGGVGWDLVGSEDRSYRTPLVHFLHGHHYWPLQFFFTMAMAHQRGQKCQRAVLRCATIFRTCTGTKFSTRTKYQNGLKQYLSTKFSTARTGIQYWSNFLLLFWVFIFKYKYIDRKDPEERYNNRTMEWFLIRT